MNCLFKFAAEGVNKAIATVVAIAVLTLIGIIISLENSRRKINESRHKHNVDKSKENHLNDIGILETELNSSSLYLDGAFLVFASSKVGPSIENTLANLTSESISILFLTFFAVLYSFIKTWSKLTQYPCVSVYFPTEKSPIEDLGQREIIDNQIAGLLLALFFLVVLPAALGWFS